MSASWRNNRIAAWIACFAILMAALAPSISHAVAFAKSGLSWVEICTAEGRTVIQVGDNQAPTQQAPRDLGAHLEHCPFCSIHANAVGLPPAPLAALPQAAGIELVPSLFYRAPRTLFVWAAGQPRAPPYAA